VALRQLHVQSSNEYGKATMKIAVRQLHVQSSNENCKATMVKQQRKWLCVSCSHKAAMVMVVGAIERIEEKS
jgi:hypothetical protein